MSRIGEVYKTNEEYLVTIIEYINNRNVIVKFNDDYGATISVHYSQCKKGTIKNPYHRDVYGVGYIGIGEYRSKQNGKYLKSYGAWRRMLERSYDVKWHAKKPSYTECSVCEEWHNFQNFARWYEENYYEIEGERMELDKDILVKGNKVYSPETCVFVPESINTLFVKNDKTRGDLPIGVTYEVKYSKYRARCSIKGQKRVHIGYYNDKQEAYEAYKQYKEQHIKEVAEYYKSHIPTKLYEAMLRYEVEITD